MSDDYPAIQSVADLRMALLGLLIFVIRCRAIVVLLKIIGGI